MSGEADEIRDAVARCPRLLANPPGGEPPVVMVADAGQLCATLVPCAHNMAVAVVMDATSPTPKTDGAEFAYRLAFALKGWDTVDAESSAPSTVPAHFG